MREPTEPEVKHLMGSVLHLIGQRFVTPQVIDQEVNRYLDTFWTVVSAKRSLAKVFVGELLRNVVQKLDPITVFGMDASLTHDQINNRYRALKEVIITTLEGWYEIAPDAVYSQAGKKGEHTYGDSHTLSDADRAIVDEMMGSLTLGGQE